MKIIVFFTLLIFSLTQLLFGQNNSDDVYYKSNDENKHHYCYSPFHQSEIDSTKNSLLETGNFLNIGFGKGGITSGKGYGVLLDYTLTYKSHLFSLSFNYSSRGYDGRWNAPQYQSNYIGLLIGESCRLQNFLASLSIGISNSNLYCYDPNKDVISSGAGIIAGTYYKRNGIAFPIQFKFQVLANNIIGLGYTFTYEVASTYPANFHNVSIIFGIWNRFKPKHNNVTK